MMLLHTENAAMAEHNVSAGLSKVLRKSIYYANTKPNAVEAEAIFYTMEPVRGRPWEADRVELQRLPQVAAGVAGSLISITAAFGIGSLLIVIYGHDPVDAIFAMFDGALGNYVGISHTLNLTAILLLTGLATLVAFSAGVWNMGMEGQLYIGGMVSVITVLSTAAFPAITLPLAIVVGALGGSAYALVPGFLKVRFGVNEIVSSLLLNYVALSIVDYIAGGPFHDAGAALNRTIPIPPEFRLPALSGSILNLSIVVAIMASVAVAFILKRTKFGFEIRMMGGNIRAARYSGVKIVQRTLLVMTLSGALAGLAGSMLAVGTAYSWMTGISKSYGFLGIGVALLAQLSPIAIFLGALFFSILNEGGLAMQSSTGVPYEVAQVMAGAIVIAVLIRPLIERRISRRA
jgi:simple sugar transport system permease protein